MRVSEHESSAQSHTDHVKIQVIDLGSQGDNVACLSPFVTNKCGQVFLWHALSFFCSDLLNVLCLLPPSLQFVVT